MDDTRAKPRVRQRKFSQTTADRQALNASSLDRTLDTVDEEVKTNFNKLP